MNTISRFDHISVAKGIGIIMVVLAHSFHMPNLLTNFICLFHMPLFFFLSGYCFKDKYINSKLVYIRRSLVTLYLPFVVTNLIFIALHNVFFNLNIYNDIYGFMDSVSKRYEYQDYMRQVYYTFRFMGQEQLLGGFWFLKSLFFARIIFLLLRWGQIKISNNVWKRNFSRLFFITSIIFCLLDLHIPGILGSGEVFGFLLLWFGYELRRKENKYIRYSNELIIVSFIVCMMYAIYRPLYFSSSPLTLDRIDYVIPCVLGCLLIYFLCLKKWLSNQKSLIYVGSHTLVILALHFLAFKSVSFIYIIWQHADIRLLAQFAVLWESPNWLWLPYTLVGVLIPLIINRIYCKVRESIIHNVRWEGRF